MIVLKNQKKIKPLYENHILVGSEMSMEYVSKIFINGKSLTRM